MVSARIHLSLRVNCKAQPKRVRYEWKALIDDSVMQERYTASIWNKFQILENTEETATEKYGRFIKANSETAAELIPEVRKKRKPKHSDDHRVMQAREKVQQALQKYLQRLEEDDRVELEKYKMDLNSVYNTLKEEELNIKLSEIEVARRNNNHRVSWQLINELCGRRTTRKGQLKGKTQQERIRNWYNHFQTLLGNPPDIVNEDEEIPTILDNLGIKEGAFTQEEYQRAKKAIVEGKAGGEDGVSPEVLKRCQVNDIILEFCNTALLHHKKPSQWSLANIIPIPKTGDLSLGRNYRGISLSSLIQKTYNKMILHRIRSKVDPWLRIYQNGFRPG